MDFLLKYKLNIFGIAVGAIGGYLYYYYVGCASGTCLITSKPFNSTLYGALMGNFFSEYLKTTIPKIKVKNDN